MGKGTRDRKRQYFLGIPIARPDDPDPEWVVAARVSEVPRPVPGSAQRECSRCQERVWLDPSTQKYAARGAKVICPHCFRSFIESQPKN